MPRLHLPGYPGRFDSDGRRMRFRRHDGIYQSDVGSLKTKPEPNIASRQCSDSSPRTRREDQRSRPIVSMSSGRLFLDRVGRHQSPSSLHRRDQIKLVARSEGTIYHRTVTSALTGCLTFRDKPKCTPRPLWRAVTNEDKIASTGPPVIARAFATRGTRSPMWP